MTFPVDGAPKHVAWQNQVETAVVAPDKKATRTEAAFDEAVTAFNNSLGAKIDQIGANIDDPGELEAFKAEAKNIMQEIADDMKASGQSAASPKHVMPEMAARKAILAANAKANEALIQLKDKYLTPDMRPQIVERGDGKVGVIKSAPKTENLVLRGAGGKGIAYPAALKQLQTTGVFKDMNTVVGTSAGAMTAMALSCGMSPDELQDLTDAMDNQHAVGKVKDFDKLYPEVDLQGGYYKAQGFVQILDQLSAIKVSQFVTGEKDKVDQALSDGKITQDEYERLHQLASQDFGSDRTDQMVTFKDLDILNRIDPQKFKNLTVTGYDKGKDDHKDRAFYFNKDNTPDVPIAVGARVSMSIPRMFATVHIDPDDKGKRQFQDGGLSSIMHSETVLGPNAIKSADQDLEEDIPNLPQSMIVGFDEKGKLNKTLHAPKDQGQTQSMGFVKKAKMWGIGQKSDDARDVAIDDKKRYNTAGVNVAPVYHGDLETTDTDPSQARIEFAKAAAAAKMSDFVEARQNQAVYETHDSVADAVNALSDQDLTLLAQGPTPEQDATELEKQFYDLAMERFWTEVDLDDDEQDAGGQADVEIPDLDFPAPSYSVTPWDGATIGHLSGLDDERAVQHFKELATNNLLTAEDAARLRDADASDLNDLLAIGDDLEKAGASASNAAYKRENAGKLLLLTAAKDGIEAAQDLKEELFSTYDGADGQVSGTQAMGDGSLPDLDPTRVRGKLRDLAIDETLNMAFEGTQDSASAATLKFLHTTLNKGEHNAIKMTIASFSPTELDQLMDIKASGSGAVTDPEDRQFIRNQVLLTAGQEGIEAALIKKQQFVDLYGS